VEKCHLKDLHINSVELVLHESQGVRGSDTPSHLYIETVSQDYSTLLTYLGTRWGSIIGTDCVALGTREPSAQSRRVFIWPFLLGQGSDVPSHLYRDSVARSPNPYLGTRWRGTIFWSGPSFWVRGQICPLISIETVSQDHLTLTLAQGGAAPSFNLALPFGSLVPSTPSSIETVSQDYLMYTLPWHKVARHHRHRLCSTRGLSHRHTKA
jgi:hypothetical protein